MGAHLVNLALAQLAPHISDTAFRVLMRMAVTALDTESANGRPAGLYFGGRELLALTLRTHSSRKAGYRRIAAAVEELVKVGAVERVGGAYTGHRQSYRLTLSTGCPVETPSGTPVGTPSPADWVSNLVPEGVPTGRPKEPEEPQSQQKSETGINSSWGSKSPARGREPGAEPEDRSDKTDQCPACGVVLDPGRVCGNRHCTRCGRTAP